MRVINRFIKVEIGARTDRHATPYATIMATVAQPLGIPRFKRDSKGLHNRMTLSRGVAGSAVFFLILVLLIQGVVVGGQADQQTPPSPKPSAVMPEGQSVTSPAKDSEAQAKKNAKPTVEEIIRLAETAYTEGKEAIAKGQTEAARACFDRALDYLLSSGFDRSNNPRLQAYYNDLVERIHQYESKPVDRKEIAEPAVLDELSKISESVLATVAPGGVKIYGNYDFDFSVAEPVLQYMEYFIAGRGRSTMEAGLERSGRYRKMAEKIFKEERVPQDLIWLAQAESGWKPNALSRASAKGIWQFIPGTGQRYSLHQTEWVDDRSGPEKSTRAAARYLRWLYDHFAGDWMLAMAAYNSGEARVDDAIARSGYADFWELYKRSLLPTETRNYVPIILSIVIVSKNQKRYGFDVKPDPAQEHDLFELPGQTDLKVVAELLGVPYEVVQELNPELRRAVSPPNQKYTIRIPKGMKKGFEAAYAKLPEDQRVRRIVIPRYDIARRPGSRYRSQVASYKTRSGDTLSTLARRYGVTVTELARLNRISERGTLHKGQTLRVPVTAREGRKARGKNGRNSHRSKPAKSRSARRR
ncbi:MAG TPA: transglycosylase SLT domain-containing protein [Blastocatellia bacterium]|nr:transglycosylase SLT domain-containing protein [Blastocatellia bacterium]